MWADSLHVSDCHVDVNDVVASYTIDDVVQGTEQTTFFYSVTERR